MYILAAVLLLALTATASRLRSCPSSLTLVVGTYTYQSWLPTSAGVGVTLAEFRRGSLRTNCVLRNDTTSGENPSYCARGRGRSLYCVNENENGTLRHMSPACYSGGLCASTRSSSTPTGAGGSTHVAVLPRRRDGRERVVVANYGGAVTSFVRDGDEYETFKYTVDPSLASFKTGQQSEPHPHMALPLYDGSVLVPDLGSDRVWRFDFANDGKLSVRDVLKMRLGDGPRHAAAGAGRNLYVVNELTNTVVRVRGCSGYDLVECERKSMRDVPPNGAAAAAIRVSADYRFLYASTRLPGTENGKITVFKLGTDGSIGDRIGVYSTGGVHPRDFYIIEKAPDCKSYVAVVNRDSDNLLLFERDTKYGNIKPNVAFSLDVKTPTNVFVL